MTAEVKHRFANAWPVVCLAKIELKVTLEALIHMAASTHNCGMDCEGFPTPRGIFFPSITARSIASLNASQKKAM